MRPFICAFIVLLVSNSAWAQSPAYTEKHRPQFHFSPPAHWMNDPNGMVYYKGEYHLFYQYYPDSTVWGPMHWGHAVSSDMLHWKHLPIALYPDSLGYIFSGSVVVDPNNSSGFQSGAEKPLVAMYTYHNMAGEKAGKNNFQTQGIAYSNDKGRTWKKYDHNPVIKNTGDKDFRDPKLSWHAASKHWIVTLAVGNQVQFYRSQNLKDWELTGSFGMGEGSHGGVWECPDLIEIKSTTGKPSKWVLFVSIGNGAPNGGSGTQYFIGRFDGKNFFNDNPKETTLWVDYGCDNYAGVTWSNAPDHKSIFLGWMSNWQYAQQVPTSPWRSAMTIPRALSLKETANGTRLFSAPVAETVQLRDQKAPVDLLSKKEHTYSLAELLVTVDIDQLKQTQAFIELANRKNEKLMIGFDQSKNQFFINRTNAGGHQFSKVFPAVQVAPRSSGSHILNMHIFIDRSSVELFADDGAVVMTDLFFPSEDFSIMRYSAIDKGQIYSLHSVWR